MDAALRRLLKIRCNTCPDLLFFGYLEHHFPELQVPLPHAGGRFQADRMVGMVIRLAEIAACIPVCIFAEKNTFRRKKYT